MLIEIKKNEQTGISKRELAEQKIILRQTIKNWQANTKQIDDISIIGIKF